MIKQTTCAGLFATMLAVTCSTSVQAISNSEEVAPDAHPYAVFLVVDDRYACTGILLDADTVLTIAACTEGAQQIKVLLGAHDISANESQQVEMNATTIITHPQYNSLNLNNNVGLIKLPESAPKTARISSITIATAELSKGAEIRGWGVQKAGDFSLSHDTLLFAPVNVEQDSVCDAYFNLSKMAAPFRIDMEGLICATSPQKSHPCNADLGAPLLQNNKLIGLATMGDCTTDTSPNLYVDVSKYSAWIESH